MPRYQLIRDKNLNKFSDEFIEVCDTPDEINNFSVKEILNLLVELKETDYKDEEIYVDIYTILKNLSNNNSIPQEEIENLYLEKLEKEGSFSKFLLKIY